MTSIGVGSETVIIAACYRPPSSNFHFFLDSLLCKLDGLRLNNNTKCVLCGDFNVDYLKYSEDQNSSNFYDSLNSIAFLPTIYKPTRITENSFSLIDNILVSNPTNFRAGIFTIDISDHLPIFFIFHDLCACKENLDSKSISYRLVNERTILNLQRAIYEYDISEIVKNPEP